MSTKQELEARIAELEAQLAQPPDLRTITVTFNLNGQLVAVASSTHSTPQEFAAQKAALQSALNQTDALLIAAVRREAQNDITKPEL